MFIKVNEVVVEVEEGVSCFTIREKVKRDCDVVILNGYPITKDRILKEGDSLSLIKKGEIPKEEDLEALLVARHTPGVYSKTKRAKIGIAGAGGLGSNIAISLARLGIGNIKIVDFDVVEPSNLNRQQYYIKDIGEFKVNALKRNLEEINPFINVQAIIKKLDKDNIAEIFAEEDIIIEAFDNPEYKAEISTKVLNTMRDKILIASSGMAGYYPSNEIRTRKINERFYICGDGESEAKEGFGLMAPRVAICANHMANCALRLILGEEGK